MKTCRALTCRGLVGMPSALSAKDIEEAIVLSEPIDCSDSIFGSHTDPPQYRPPILISLREEFEPQLVARDLTTSKFETLSLVARANLLGLAPNPPKDAPEWVRRIPSMTQCTGADVVAAIASAAERLADRRGAPQLGLQLIGARISGDVDLTNVRLPFSVRFIGCAIDGAVRIGRSHLDTLDLSGCAVRGVFGSFLNTRGSVRLRRLTSTSALDFGGARVADVFDATDVVVIPLDDPPARDAYVGDRGVFNLSLAELSNEVRMLRARVYGGLTMKGCHIKRSFFLDDAILRSPIAFVERLGLEFFADGNPTVARLTAAQRVQHLALAIRTSGRAEYKLAYELHGNPDDSTISAELRKERRYRCQLETCETYTISRKFYDQFRDDASGRSRGRLFLRLLGESIRARGSCLRADGLQVDGSIFARSIKAGGRLRCKYVKVGGSVHLNGARMRSAKDINDGIGDLSVDPVSEAANNRHCRGSILWALDRAGNDGAIPLGEFAAFFRGRLLDKTLSHARTIEPEENDDYALDFRHSRISGDLSLGADARVGQVGEYDAELGASLRSILGRLASKDLEALVAEKFFEERRYIHCSYVHGQIALQDTRIDGDLTLSGVLANMHRVRRRGAVDNNAAFLLIEQTKIDGELDLRRSVGVEGIDGQHVRIGARIRFAKHSVRKGKLDDRAHFLRGKIQLSDARIGGDAQFIFARKTGPHLLLARGKIEGRLSILPALGDLENVPPRHPSTVRRLQLLSRRVRVWRRNWGPKLRTSDPIERLPEIDLRSSSATEFGHHVNAWPAKTRLRIEGLAYERTHPYGPLTPRRKSDHPRIALVAPWLVGVAALGLPFALAFLMLGGGGAAAPIDGIGPVRVWENFYGEDNVRVALSVVGFMFIGGVVRSIQKDMRPRALEWLRLQRPTKDEFKIGRTTIALQPHIQAAKVLRAAGMVLAANEVEVDRLRQRCSQLSWRFDWMAKILLRLTDAATRYGYDPLRTMSLALLIGALAACLFHLSDLQGFVRPLDGSLLQEAGGEEVIFAHLNLRDGFAADERSLYPSFSSGRYVLDAMVPGLDLGDERLWQIQSQPIPDSLTHNQNARNTWSRWRAAALPLLKLAGLFLLTTIGVAVVTRLETLAARNEE